MNPIISIHSTFKGSNVLLVNHFNKIDTILELQNSIIKVDQRSYEKRLDLILKIQENYVYISVENNGSIWKINKKNSGRIISNDPHSKDPIQLNFVDDNIQIKSNFNKVLLPIKKLNKDELEQLEIQDAKIPPLPPISINSIIYDLRADSIYDTRKKRINDFVSTLSNQCIEDDSKIYLQLQISKAGQLEKYKVLESEHLSYPNSEESLNCIKDKLEKNQFDFGSLELLNNIASKANITVALKKND